MTKQNTNKLMQKGSMMVEALALLGLITMVTPVMYKKAAERTTELQDINVATQMRTLNNALDSYVRNNYSPLEHLIPTPGDKLTVNAKDDANEVVQGVKAYLPAGFNIAQSKYFDIDNMKFTIERKEVQTGSGSKHSSYTSAVLAPAISPMKLNRASKIASMIGINGGTIKGTKFEGTQGAWSADPSAWFGADPANLKLGSLMSISSEVIAEGAKTDTSKFLHRNNDDGEDKTTMESNLIMGGNNITEIGALFGSGNNISIGGDGAGEETNLTVWGKLILKRALEVVDLVVSGTSSLKGNTAIGGDAAPSSGKILTVYGDTEMDGNLDVKGGVTIGEGEAEVGKSLTVHGDTQMNGTLDVTGNTTVGGTLDVTEKTTLQNELEVAGIATFNSGIITGRITAPDPENGTVTIGPNVAIEKNLTVGRALSADHLHAKRKLTVGGELSGTPGTIMAVEDGSIRANTSKSWLSMNNSDISLYNFDTGMDISEGAFRIRGQGGTRLHGEFDPVTKASQVDISAHNETSNAWASVRAGSDRTSMSYGSNDATAGKIEITPDHILMRKTDSLIGIREKTIDINSGVHSLIELKEKKATVEAGRSNLILQDGNVEINAIGDYGPTLLYIQEGGTLTFADDGNTKSFNITPEDMTLGKIGDDRDNPAIYFSRKGYIEIASPNNNDNTSGETTGYIKARRLVSDVPYVDYSFANGCAPDEAFCHNSGRFHGNASEAGAYDYYQVNPAYTSIMNDIKLASRGGARLSDILSDYVIKGVYVADNTYHAGYDDKTFTGKQEALDNNAYGDALFWEFIPFKNGLPDPDVFKEAQNENDVTICNGEGDGPNGCEIYSCQSSNCVASPWLGYIPKPQCPRGYKAVVTNNPIRWRMSEVYYLTNQKIEDLKSASNGKQYNKLISDLNSRPYGRGTKDNPDPNDPEIKDRFNQYFGKLTNPRNTLFTTENETAELGTPHQHKIATMAFQTNTWLNSSVDPYISDGKILGWHLLMGFLYRPGEYDVLLSDMGYDTSDIDAIHWNIFPVYAQEMASIATTYCAFARGEITDYDADGNPIRDWKWNENNSGPVLDYNQLDPNTYRDPTGSNRNPANRGSSRGTEWEKQVNDPSLPYDDAW